MFAGLIGDDRRFSLDAMRISASKFINVNVKMTRARGVRRDFVGRAVISLRIQTKASSIVSKVINPCRKAGLLRV